MRNSLKAPQSKFQAIPLGVGWGLSTWTVILVYDDPGTYFSQPGQSSVWIGAFFAGLDAYGKDPKFIADEAIDAKLHASNQEQQITLRAT
jgi:hypothetical protein